jgi:response regulator RpfG family c-di-GMP phosphodiesterase
VTAPLRALIADDDAGVRNVLRLVLLSQGYQVLEATDGAEGLERYRAEKPDLILSDLQMPRLDGIGFLRGVREHDDTVAFLILTGAGTMENAVEALRLQADDYLVKPFNTDEVALACTRALSYRRLLRENRAYQQHLESRVAEQAREIEGLLADAIRALAIAIETRDDYTGGHVERVSRLAAATGREMGLAGAELRALWVAALLHDVGKIGVPDAILRKPSALTAEEFEQVKRHPEVGANIMAASSFLRPGLLGVLHHQERWDGNGYPAGLRGEEISLHGRIIAVVDCYDAVVSGRPYSAARTEQQALDELEACAGTQFDPGVVRAFVRAAEKGFPQDPDVPQLPERWSPDLEPAAS